MNKDFIKKMKDKINIKGKKDWRLVVAILLAVIVIVNVSYLLFRGDDNHAGHGLTEHTEYVDNKVVKYWTCSMHPQIKLPNKGLCPICAMELIPVYADTGVEEDASKVSLTLNSVGVKLAEIATAEVRYGGAGNQVRLVGKIDYDETRLSYISAWVPGRIDKLFVDFTGVKVSKGSNLIKLYSPELLAAQEEYLQAIKNVNDTKDSTLSVIKSTARNTLVSSEEKLKLYGISQAQIEEIVKRGTPDKYMTIKSPITGTVIHKNGVEGMYVKTGDRIYTIADLSLVWLYLDAYESDIKWLRNGQELNLEVESYPGEIFKGKIAFIDPFVNEKTRTIRVRVNVTNHDDKLKPGMFVRTTAQTLLAKDAKSNSALKNKDNVLLIPATAPLITGKRAIVYIESDSGKETTSRYEGREIVLGPKTGDSYVVLSGLKAGERVVTRGNFKIDSALQIQAKPSMMNPAGHYNERENVLGEGTDTAAGDAGILSSALPHYFSASKALSEDNQHMAAEGLNNFKKEIEKILVSRSLGKGDDPILKEIKRLNEGLANINHDMTMLRKQFSDTSQIIREILDKYEYKENSKLYLLFCPEAFDNKGGYWLNNSSAVNNPYLGTAMLTCGEVKGEYGATVKGAKPQTGHEGHTM